MAWFSRLPNSVAASATDSNQKSTGPLLLALGPLLSLFLFLLLLLLVSVLRTAHKPKDQRRDLRYDRQQRRHKGVEGIRENKVLLKPCVKAIVCLVSKVANSSNEERNGEEECCGP